MSSGSALGHEGDGLLDVDPGLTRVPELDEEAGADAALAEPPAGVADVVDGRLLVHRVEHPLAAALGAQPHLFAPGAGERIDRLVGHQVAARLHRERHARPRALETLGELVQPVAAQAEDVVGEPHMIRCIGLVELDELARGVARRAHGVALTPDGLGAPVAVIRAAARRHHVEREPTVMLLPQGPVGVDVDEIPRRSPEHVRVPFDGPMGPLHLQAIVQRRHPGDIREGAVRIVGQPLVDDLAHRVFAFAEQARRGSGRKVQVGVVGDVGTAHRDAGNPPRVTSRPSSTRPRACAAGTSWTGS